MTEAGRCKRESPRRIERTAGGNATQQITVGIEHIDHTQPFAVHIVYFIRTLLRVSYVNIAINGLNAEGTEPRRNVRIDEFSGNLYRRKLTVEHIDFAVVKI